MPSPNAHGESLVAHMETEPEPSERADQGGGDEGASASVNEHNFLQHPTVGPPKRGAAKPCEAPCMPVANRPPFGIASTLRTLPISTHTCPATWSS